MTLVAAGVALFGFDKSVAILLLVGLGGFSYTYYHRGHRLYFIFFAQASWFAPRIAGVN